MKTALITGASSGIGRATAVKLHNEGYYILNASRRRQTKDGGGKEKDTDLFVDGDFFLCDFSSTEEVNTLLTYVNVRKKLLLDVVVCNAGYMNFKQHYKHNTIDDIVELNKLMNTNLISHYYLVDNLIYEGLFAKEAVIIFISSTAGIRGEPEDIPYGMAKAGLMAMTKGFAKKYKEYRFVCIAPGLIKTFLTGSDAIPEELITPIPVGRPGTPQEVANLIYEVIKNKFINGATLVIDGGELG